MKPEEREQLVDLLGKMKEEEERGSSSSESFYLPTNLPEGFYLGDTAMLRKLNTPSAEVFRKLLGIS